MEAMNLLFRSDISLLSTRLQVKRSRELGVEVECDVCDLVETGIALEGPIYCDFGH